MRKYHIEFYDGAYPLYIQAKNMHGAKIAVGRYIAKTKRPLKIRNITEIEVYNRIEWNYL